MVMSFLHLHNACLQAMDRRSDALRHRVLEMPFSMSAAALQGLDTAHTTLANVLQNNAGRAVHAPRQSSGLAPPVTAPSHNNRLVGARSLLGSLEPGACPILELCPACRPSWPEVTILFSLALSLLCSVKKPIVIFARPVAGSALRVSSPLREITVIPTYTSDNDSRRLRRRRLQFTPVQKSVTFDLDNPETGGRLPETRDTMEAWRNITALNYTNPRLLFAAFNATTAQWGFGGFNASALVLLPDYLNETTALLYPNTTFVVEGVGAFMGLGDSLRIDQTVYLFLSLVVVASLAMPTFRALDAVARPKGSSASRIPRSDVPGYGMNEKEFWRRLQELYTRPPSELEPLPGGNGGSGSDLLDGADDAAAQSFDNGFYHQDPNHPDNQFHPGLAPGGVPPAKPVTADDVRRVVELMRDMYRLQAQIRAQGYAINVTPEERDATKRRANAVAARINAAVRGWAAIEQQQVGGGPAGGVAAHHQPWTDEERGYLRRIIEIVSRQPAVPYPLPPLRQ